MSDGGGGEGGEGEVSWHSLQIPSIMLFEVLLVRLSKFVEEVLWISVGWAP